MSLSFEDWAARHNFGEMVPEGDGWGWYFRPSDEARKAYDELVNSTGLAKPAPNTEGYNGKGPSFL